MIIKYIAVALFILFTLNSTAAESMQEILTHNKCTLGLYEISPQQVETDTYRDGSVLFTVGSFKEPTGLWIRRYVLLRISNSAPADEPPLYYVHAKLFENIGPIPPKDVYGRFKPAPFRSKLEEKLEKATSPCTYLWRARAHLVDNLRESGTEQSVIDEYNRQPYKSCDTLSEAKILTSSLDVFETVLSSNERFGKALPKRLRLRCNW